MAFSPYMIQNNKEQKIIQIQIEHKMVEVDKEENNYYILNYNPLLFRWDRSKAVKIIDQAWFKEMALFYLNTYALDQ